MTINLSLSETETLVVLASLQMLRLSEANELDKQTASKISSDIYGIVMRLKEQDNDN